MWPRHGVKVGRQLFAALGEHIRFRWKGHQIVGYVRSFTGLEDQMCVQPDAWPKTFPRPRATL